MISHGDRRAVICVFSHRHYTGESDESSHGEGGAEGTEVEDGEGGTVSGVVLGLGFVFQIFEKSVCFEIIEMGANLETFKVNQK